MGLVWVGRVRLPLMGTVRLVIGVFGGISRLVWVDVLV